MAMELVENNLGKGLTITPKMTSKQLSVHELVIHFNIVMRTVENRLHEPFTTMISKPGRMKVNL
jgi:hypothetical protein